MRAFGILLHCSGAPLKHRIYELSESFPWCRIRGVCGPGRRLVRGLTAELDGGWTFERRFVFREPDVTLKTKGAPYVQVSLNTRF